MSRARFAVAIATVLCSTAAAAAGPTKQECVRANEAGQDLRRAGSLQEATKKLALCVAATCPEAVRQDCAERLREAERAAPSIVFDVKDATGADVSDVIVHVDGVLVVDHTLGTALPVDPGARVFRFEGPGRVPVEKHLVIAEGDKERRERIVLDVPKLTEVLPVAPVAPAPAPAEPGPESGRGGGMRAGAWVAGSIGLASVAGGLVAGLLATSKHTTLDRECDVTCPLSAKNDLDGFHTLRTLSTIGYAVGGAGLVLSGVLFLASPRASSAPSAGRRAPTLAVWLGPGSIGLRGEL